ncbi:hypothetical protein KKD70_00815, partial [Patescibacteria group bacterium]|nr:hypothetical protein [Patescibacteria group bacterium]
PEPGPEPEPESEPDSEPEPDNAVSFKNEDDWSGGDQGLVAGGLGAAAGAAASMPSEPEVSNAEEKSEWDKMKEQIKEDHAKTEQDLNDKKPEVELDQESDQEELTNENLPKMGAFAAAALGGAAVGAGIAGATSDQNKDEVLEGEVTSPETSGDRVIGEGNPMEDDDAEREEVFRIIKKYVGTGCVVIVLLVAIFLFQIPQRLFGAVSGFIFGDGSQNETVDTNVDGNDEQYEVSGNGTSAIQSIFVIGHNRGITLEDFDSGAQTALLAGDDNVEANGVSGAIRAGFVVGVSKVDFQNADIIATYMNVLMKLQNAFSTDIHQMLNSAQNRSVALEAHISELDSLQEEALTTLREINEKKDNLKISFNEATTLKEKLEADFFVSIDQLEGNKANYLLDEFIETSKRQVDLKAQYNALNRLSELFDYATLNMDVRIKDIKYNREPLVKGIQVVDIKGSDLELIIQEPEL